MLSKKLQGIADYYVLAGITKEQVEELSGMKYNELPEEFDEYCKQVEKDYYDYCNSLQEWEKNNDTRRSN